MIYYAIRHKPTGFFLPVAKGRTGSRVEPECNCCPRLFKEERHAKGYLTVWLQGIFETGKFQTYEGEWEEDLDIIPQPHRKRENMEIIPMRLIEESQNVSTD